MLSGASLKNRPPPLREWNETNRKDIQFLEISKGGAVKKWQVRQKTKGRVGGGVCLKLLLFILYSDVVSFCLLMLIRCCCLLYVSVDRAFQQKCIKMFLEHLKMPHHVRDMCS